MQPQHTFLIHDSTGAEELFEAEGYHLTMKEGIWIFSSVSNFDNKPKKPTSYFNIRKYLA